MELAEVIENYDKRIPEETRTIVDAFAVPSRRAIMLILQEKGELSFKEILSLVDPMNTSTLTQHLKSLVRSGLVENIYKKTVGTRDYSMYRLSELGDDFLKSMITVKKIVKTNNAKSKGR
jgi:DNA-binding HxlR family transcriptional regulator